MKKTKKQHLRKKHQLKEEKRERGQAVCSQKGRGVLAKYFPMIRSREAVRDIIMSRKELKEMFLGWPETKQDEFLDFCSGAKGLKVLYDGVFKEIMNPETMPERLADLLSLLLEREVSIKAVLPNDSVRLGAESSLLYTDIIVQLDDGSLSNVEIQKVGYLFPGERSACYSADHLLRQYKRVRGKNGEHFTYRDIKRVYTIVFFEESTGEFHQFPENWIHKFAQQSNTGLSLELLQKYIFIPLDIFRQTMDNKIIENDLEAWLAFLSFDDPERIEELIAHFPKFRDMYQDIYELCLNTERVMRMYSKELQELDRNTVKYMIDGLEAQRDKVRAELDKTNAELDKTNAELDKTNAELDKANTELDKANTELDKANTELDRVNAERNEMRIRNDELEQRVQKLEELIRKIPV